jgi:hypothetical protein
MTSLKSYLKRQFSKQWVTIVSGLPRSGTSMMMSALKAGGMPLLVDGVREADANNPKGYYEFERVKKMPSGDIAWVRQARGKAVKVISALLSYLPEQYAYRVIFMEREMAEILASQERMLKRNGKESEDTLDDAILQAHYAEHLAEVKSLLSRATHLRTCFASYNQILRQPRLVFGEIADFLDSRVDVDSMVGMIDPELYRERHRS